MPASFKLGSIDKFEKSQHRHLRAQRDSVQNAVKNGRERILMIKKDELVKWMEENNDL